MIALCGLPGSGKTTTAKQIERNRPALRLSQDEWVSRLFGASAVHNNRVRESIKDVQWDIAAQALQLGVDVVLDWGFWGRSERDDYRERVSTLGVTFELHYLDVPRQELWRRLEARNAALPPDTFPIDEAMLDIYCAMFQPPTTEEII